MGDVVTLPVITTLDCPPDRVLDAAKGHLQSAVVIGYHEDGSFYFASSIAGGPETLWLLALAEKRLVEIGDS